MRPLLTMLMVISLTVGALAQYCATAPTICTTCPTTASVAPCPGTCAQPCPGTCVQPCPCTCAQSCPCVQPCPCAQPCPCNCAMTLPGPCAAVAAPNITGDTVILVLGSEESYALCNLPVRPLLYEDVARDYSSIFSPFNPLRSYHPNQEVTRGGNPYYPYYQVNSTCPCVAGTCECYNNPCGLSTGCCNVLNAVRNQYSCLTPQQAVAMGYCTNGQCVPGLGMVYLNQQLVDNTFNAMQPEAFLFSADGHVLGVQYILLADQPYSLFCQQMQPCSIAPCAQQLTVWLWCNNPNGMFAACNPYANTNFGFVPGCQPIAAAPCCTIPTAPCMVQAAAPCCTVPSAPCCTVQTVAPCCTIPTVPTPGVNGY